MMGTSEVQPGIPVTLKELHTTSIFFKQGASLRVTGKLQLYNMEMAVAIITDDGVNLKIDTRHLMGMSFSLGSIYQFIGELHIQPDRDVILQARVGRNVDGIDLSLYHQSLLLLRNYETEVISSRMTLGDRAL